MKTEVTNLLLLTISAQKAEKYPIRWLLWTGFNVICITGNNLLQKIKNHHDTIIFTHVEEIN